ncbi:MAG: SDR family oxidoreductase [Thermoanaerobaculia bacterium]
MKILILGGSGMLGHKLWMRLSKNHDVWITLRKGAREIPDHPAFRRDRIRSDVDALNFDEVTRALASIQPDYVVNCIGIIKQLPLALDPLSVIQLNALLPHRISLICRTARIRMLHISSDCVFSGRRGHYTEADQSDAEDLYGRTKFLGEVSYPHTLTLRTSIIGRELFGYRSLVEWFLGQRGKTTGGYTKVPYTGVTTNALAEIINQIIERDLKLSGVFQVASEPITKYDLLVQLRDAMKLDIAVTPDDREICDRTLDGSRFTSETGIVTPSWEEMISALAADETPYDEWRRASERRTNHA